MARGLSRIAGLGFRGGWGILSKLKLFFLIFFFGIMLVNTVIISIQAHDASVGVKYIGNKFIKATDNLNNDSLKIIENKGIYNNSKGKLRGLWGLIVGLYNISESLFTIYIWIKLLSLFAMHLIIFDSSKPTSSMMVGLILFIGTQMIFIKTFTDGDLMTPIYSFMNFIKSIPYMITPISTTLDKFSKIDLFTLKNSTNIASITNITN